MNHSFNVDVAIEVGLEAAIIFENISFWLEKSRANNENIKDGYAWIYNSRAAWCELMPYMGEKQIRNAVERLVSAGLVVRGHYSYGPMNRTYWYRLGERANLFGRNGQTKFGPKGQTKTDIETIIDETDTPLTPTGGGSADRFAEFWDAWPKHQRKAAKAQCEALWRKEKLDAVADDILPALERFKASYDWQKAGGQYIPAPLVWLRQQRWQAADALKAPSVDDEKLPF